MHDCEARLIGTLILIVLLAPLIWKMDWTASQKGPDKVWPDDADK